MTLMQATLTLHRALIVTDATVYRGPQKDHVHWSDGAPVTVQKQFALPHIGAVLVGVGTHAALAWAADHLRLVRDFAAAIDQLPDALRAFSAEVKAGTEVFLIGWHAAQGTMLAVHCKLAHEWRPALLTPQRGTLALMHPAARPESAPLPKCMESAEAYARAAIEQARAADPRAPFGGPLLVTELTRYGMKIHFAQSAGLPPRREGAADLLSSEDVAAYQASKRAAQLHCVAVPGGVAISVTPSTEADVRTGGALEVRVGASWAAGTRIYRGPADRFTWPWPAQGAYTLRAKWIDSSGNESATDATLSLTVDDRIGITKLAETIDAGPYAFAAADGTSKASTAFTLYGGESLILTAAVDTKVPLSSSGSRYVEGTFSIRVDGTDHATQPFAVEVLPGGSVDAVKTVFLSKTLSGLAAGSHTASLYFAQGSLAGANASDNLTNFVVTVAVLRA